MKPIKIGIIDSGFSNASKNILVEEQFSHYGENDFDTLFHGQGIATIISDYSKKVDLINIKIFFDDLECRETVLIKAIEECIREKVDIINISVGCNTYSKELQQICEDCMQLGIIIVAAKDSLSESTYPADFKNVVRVIGDEHYKYGMWSIDSNLNVFACKSWDLKLRSKSILFYGSSFACAFITAIISNYLMEYENASYREIIDHLTLYSGRVGFVDSLKNDSGYLKADLYPLNWSNSCILRHTDLLQNIEISNLYVPKGHGLKGKTLCEAFQIEGSNLIINEGIENIVFSDSDGVIIYKLISDEDKEIEQVKYILDLCIEANKDVIFLDIFPEELMYSCSIKAAKQLHYIWTNTWNHLNKVQVTTQANITAVISTSGNNSVVDLEAAILKSMIKKNDAHINWNFIVSSPVAVLWGQKNHNTAFYDDVTLRTRFEVAESYKYNYDVSIIGIPHPVLKWNSTYHKTYDEFRGLEEIVAVNPSSIIMGINASDPIEYIEDTINILEATLGVKPDLIVIGNYAYDNETYIDNTLLYLPMTKKEMLERCKYVQKNTKIPCCILDRGADAILNCILQ